MVLPVFLLTLVYPIRIDGYLNPYDEGLWLGAAQALLNGQRLYRDVFFHYGPLLGAGITIALHSAYPTLAHLRIAFYVLNIAGLLLLYTLVLRWVRSPALRLSYAVILFAVPLAAHVPTIPMPARYAAGFLPMVLWLIEEDRALSFFKISFLGGLASIFAIGISQEVGLAALISSGYFFGVGLQAGKTRRGFLCGASLTLLLAAAGMAVSGQLNAYLSCAFLQTGAIVSKDFLPLPSLSAAVYNSSGPWFVFWQGLADILALYLPAITYAGFFCYLFRAENRTTMPRRIIALALYGALASCTAWGRSDRWHIYFALSPALLLWAVLADRLDRSRKNAVSLFTLMLGALLVIPHAEARHMKDRLLRDFGRQTDIARVGSSRLPPSQAAGYEYLAHWTQTHTKPKESVLFYPYDGAYYFLVDRPLPTFFPVLVLANTKSLQDKALNELRASPPKWAIWDQENTAFDGIPIRIYLKPIQDFLENRYRIYERKGPFVFLKLKSD